MLEGNAPFSEKRVAPSEGVGNLYCKRRKGLYNAMLELIMSRQGDSSELARAERFDTRLRGHKHFRLYIVLRLPPKGRG